MFQSLLSKSLLLVSALLSGVGLILAALAVHRSTLPYNSEGNYYDGVVNYHEQAVIAYGVMAGAAFFAAVIVFGIALAVREE